MLTSIIRFLPEAVKKTPTKNINDLLRLDNESDEKNYRKQIFPLSFECGSDGKPGEKREEKTILLRQQRKNIQKNIAERKLHNSVNVMYFYVRMFIQTG